MGVVSKKQIAANRRNARKSTGPRTPKGKASSRLNAFRHGLTAAQAVLPDESEDEFEVFHASLVAELAPSSVFEAELVDDIVHSLWRLRRARRIEVSLLKVRQAEYTIERTEEKSGLETKKLIAEQIPEIFVGPEVDPEVGRAHENAQRKELRLGHAYVLDIKSDDGLTKLSRYETTLRRNLERTLSLLARAKDERQHGKGDFAKAPSLVDLTAVKE